jgi:glucokinase
VTSTLAVDVGGTKFTLGGFADSTLLHRETFTTDREGGPQAMLATIESTLGKWRESGFQPDRCGIGFGGPVNYPKQEIFFSTHVEGWLDYPLVDRISAAAGCQAVVDNDANVGALGERYFGAGRELPSLLYLTISTGIGGGIIVGGDVLRGADSYGGEIGHMTVVPDGPECLCGARGCLERMCCGLWLERDFGKPAKELLQDPTFVRQYVVNLARGLKAAFMILNPHAIILGGGISNAGPALFKPLQEEIERQMTSWSKARRVVKQAELGDNSVLYGALQLAKQLNQ